MAIITEEEDEPKTLVPPENKKSTMKNPKPQPQNPFPFWFYFTLILSLATLIFVSLSVYSLHNNPRSWFLSLPPSLRQHYSSGRTIKVQVHPDESPIEVFVTESGPPIQSENVVIVHGLGLSSYAFKETIQSLGSKGIHGVAIDLPGNGFSDKTMVVVGGGDREIGFVGRVKEVYGLIQEKGVFWAFDQMVETGDLPYEEIMKIQNSKRRSVKAIELGSDETARVLSQVIDTLDLSPVHLVLHDSALGLASNWVSENPQSVRSVTLVDSSVNPALPLWVLHVPVIREILLGFSYGFKRLVSLRCAKEMTLGQVEAHRVLLKGRNGREAVVGSLKKLNHSFDIAQWGNSDVVSSIPMQVVWAREVSDVWSEEGQRVAKALPKAKFVTHSGSRWPQESKSGELTDYIADFVSALPRSVRRDSVEAIPEKVQKILDEAKAGGDHGHEHTHAGYTDAYGLGEGWAT